ncbi:PD-(D/E)XK motif protein [Actinomadura gamaensis]|uniref:PD-(D/E)XK motif protein n=1 Tax=Actinomadura gamaensis TaxID=1763541 RepID=A0ABV9UD61_9ACTN
MNPTEADWEQLNTPAGARGRSMLRLHGDSPHNLFIAVSHPDRQRMLILETDTSSYEQAAGDLGSLPRTGGLEMRFARVSRNSYELVAVLTSDELREVFTPLVSDIAGAVASAPDSLGAVRAAIDRFRRWQDLLKAVGEDGLGSEARRGLFGELLFLNEFVLPARGAHDAVLSWTGPQGADQDFQLPQLTVEVKCSSTRASSEITIANERQLDSTSAPNLLLALFVLDERRGGTGTSLNVLVEQARHRLLGPETRARFDDLLVNAGYFRHHRQRYDEPRYTVRDIRFWSVSGDFPRVVVSDLRPGVTSCRYRIHTTGLDQYRLQDKEVRSLIEDQQ